MYKIEVNTTINKLIAVFYRFGIWQKEKPSVFRNVVRKLLFLLNHILFQILIIVCALQATDKSEFIFLVEVEGHIFFLTIKLVFLLWKKDDVLAFVHDCAHTILDRREFMEATKKIQNLMKFGQTYLLVMVVVLMFAIVSSLPIFSSEKKLPLYTNLSFHSKYDEIIYWFTYAYILYNLVFVIVFNSITIIIWYVMLNCSIEYQVLGNRLANLGVVKAEKSAVEQHLKDSIEYQVLGNRLANLGVVKAKKTAVEQHLKAKNRNDYHQDLVSLVETHQNVSEKIDRFKLCFHTLFLVQITISGIAICVSTYILAFGSQENPFLSATYVEILLYGLVDIFLVMYLGNEIKVASSRLSYYVFESPWFEQEISCKQNLLILCEVLKQPKALVIFKLYPLNLDTFTSIIKLSYSMYNILQSFT